MRTLLIVCLSSLAVVAAQVQDPPAFEVVSIKPSPPMTAAGLNVRSGSVQPGGRWISQNARFIDIVRAVYREYLERGRIVGGPLWVNSARFDITAIASGEPASPLMFEMMKRVLADRFKLRVHTERRSLEVYTLLPARADGRLGPGLRRVDVDCAAVRAARARGESPADGPGGRPQCNSRVIEGPGDQLRLVAGGVSLETLVMQVRGTLARIVVDGTRLTGAFDIDFEWSSDPRLLATSPGGDSAPHIFPALEQQLGLKLELRQEPMDVLVIDHAEMPTPD